MYPWLRLIQVSARPLAALDLLDTSSIRLRVWPNDLDFNLHINNGRYLTLADLGRMDWFRRTGLLKAMRRQGGIPIVGDAIAKFRREIRAWQSFEIRTRIAGWGERWGFLEHRFVRAERVVGVVAVRGQFRGPNGPLPPGPLMASLGASTVSPPLPAWIREWSDSCDALSQALRTEEADRGLR